MQAPWQSGWCRAGIRGRVTTLAACANRDQRRAIPRGGGAAGAWVALQAGGVGSKQDRVGEHVGEHRLHRAMYTLQGSTVCCLWRKRLTHQRVSYLR